MDVRDEWYVIILTIVAIILMGLLCISDQDISFATKVTIEEYSILVFVIFSAIYFAVLRNYHKPLDSRKSNHFKTQIAPTLEEWLKPQPSPHIVVSPMPLPLDSTELSKVSLLENRIIVSQVYQEPENLPYFKETMEHLKEYSNITDPWKKALTDNEDFKAKTKELLTKIDDALRKVFIEAGFTDVAQSDTNFWVPWVTTWAVYQLLLGKSDVFSHQDYIFKAPNSYLSNLPAPLDGFAHQRAEAGGEVCFKIFNLNPAEYDDMLSKIMQLTPQFKEQIDEINKLKLNVKTNLDTFRKEKHDLIKQIMADKKIKGKCELCP